MFGQAKNPSVHPYITENSLFTRYNQSYRVLKLSRHFSFYIYTYIYWTQGKVLMLKKNVLSGDCISCYAKISFYSNIYHDLCICYSFHGNN